MSLKRVIVNESTLLDIQLPDFASTDTNQPASDGFYTGCGCHNVSRTSCVCWCTTAWKKQHRDTCPPIHLTMSVGSNARRQLRSASTSDLGVHVPPTPTRRALIGDCAFAIAGQRAWNSLPPALRSTSRSFSFFKKKLWSFHFVCDDVKIDNDKCPRNSSYRIIALNKWS